MKKQTAIRIVAVVGTLLLVVVVASLAFNVSQRGKGDSVIGAREAELKQNLLTLRNAIDQYTLDKQKAPQSLDDLVQGGYLKVIPKDPMTNSTDTWKLAMQGSQTQPGISDVHSGSDQTGTDGTVYSTW